MRPDQRSATQPMNAETSEDTTEDAFLGGALHILQPKRGYRAGLDAVLLAAAAPCPQSGRADLLDAGSGVGTVGLCMARRCAATHVTLIEREPMLADLARRNTQRNALADRMRVIEADLSLGGALAQGNARHPDLAPAMFDHVVANPPYRVAGTGTAPPGLKATAHQLADGDLHRWLAALTTLSRADASLTLVHEAAALPAILAAIGGRYGSLAILPVHPRSASPANRVIVQGRKGSRAPLTLLPPFILHGDGQDYTAEAEAILRHGAALSIAVR